MLVYELLEVPYWNKELQRVKKAETIDQAAVIFTGSAREKCGYLRPGKEHYKQSIDWAHMIGKKSMTMSQYYKGELIKKLLNKTQGNEPFFDYSPSDVMFWEEIRNVLENIDVT